jgi:hypothetical protein
MLRIAIAEHAPFGSGGLDAGKFRIATIAASGAELADSCDIDPKHLSSFGQARARPPWAWPPMRPGHRRRGKFLRKQHDGLPSFKLDARVLDGDRPAIDLALDIGGKAVGRRPRKRFNGHRRQTIAGGGIGEKFCNLRGEPIDHRSRRAGGTPCQPTSSKPATATSMVGISGAAATASRW